MRRGHHDMYTDRKHHHDMYVGVEFKFEKLHALFPFELARFPSLDSPVIHHLWIIQMNSFLFLNWWGFCV